MKFEQFVKFKQSHKSPCTCEKGRYCYPQAKDKVCIECYAKAHGMRSPEYVYSR